MKKKLCRKQAGGPVKLDAVDYLQSYMQSPEFKKRFAKYNYLPEDYEKQLTTSKNARKKLKPFLITKEDPNDEIGSRVSNPTFNKVFSSKEQPIPLDANILLSVPQAKQIGADINNDILPHEYSHQARSLNDIETLYTAFRNKNPKAGALYGEYQKHKFSSPKDKDLSFERYLKEKKKMDHHDFGPSENHADLDTLRWLMHKNGIYDTRKGNMTIEDLNKAKANPAINKSFNFKRLKKNFKDADIIWMNNTIASNVEDDSSLTTAKKGGTITTTGYLSDSPDRHNDFNIIPGNQITMKGVKKKLVGIDNLGNQQLMVPGGEYVFPGSYVTEIPVRQQGGPTNLQDNTKVVPLKIKQPLKNTPGIPIKQRDDFEGNFIGELFVDSRNDKDVKSEDKKLWGRYNKLSDLYKYFVGAKLEHDVLYPSKYKPNNSKDPKAKYISINDPQFLDQVVASYNRAKQGKLAINAPGSYLKEHQTGPDTYNISGYKRDNERALGHYTVSKGKDDSGDYISYYDKFDVTPGKSKSIFEKLGLGKAFEIYDRIYLDKNGKPVKKQLGGPLNAQDRSHWNGYVDYLESKGYKGSKELDSRDTNLSKKLFDEFSKGQYSYDEFVPRVQTDISSYRQQAMEMIRSGKAEFKGDLNKLDEVFMPGLSNVDAWAGSRTTSWKFPNEKVPVTEVGTGRYVKDMNNMVYSKINKKQLGGAAYEMPWSKFNRPEVKIPYRLPSAPFEWGDPNAAAPEGLDKPINPMTAEQKFAQQVQQQQQVTEFAPDASVNPKGNKIKDFLNKITPGNMASGLIEEYANPYSLTNTTSNLAGVATYFDNKRKSKANDAYMRSQMSADNVFGVDNREDRGDYVNTGTSYGMFRPDQMGAKSPDGMYSGKFYNNMAEGGYIPEEISTPQMMGNTSTREMVGDMMVPEFATALAIPVNAFNFPTREVNVNVNKNTKDAYAYYTKDKNLPAHIAAGIVGNLFQESGLKPGAVEKTNTANGRGIAQWDVRDRWQGLLSWASSQGRDPYDLKTQLDYVLVEPGESGKAMNKLKNSKTPEEAAIIFGKLYERPSEKHANWNMRTSVANKLYNNQFKEGGEYEMSADEIAELRKQGYDIEEL